MKTEGRIKVEQTIINKIQKIFDNIDLIDEFKITIKGGTRKNTTLEYKVAERIIPQLEEKEEDKE